MHHWVQLPMAQVKLLKEQSVLVNGSGYQYMNNDGDEMAEFHVDALPNSIYNEKVCDAQFGRCLGIWRDPSNNPIFSFGQDECIFKQYPFTGITWVGQNGEMPIVPKDKGYGIMISAFQSREFGFGFPMNCGQLKFVNDQRASNRAMHTCHKSTTAINGNAVKPLLTKSPFVTEFEYGANSQGYWTFITCQCNLKIVLMS